MAGLIRRKDWSGTPPGPPESWPSSLRTLIHMMLTSRFPMLIFWGPELITFYNDAFRPSLGHEGKHPSSLGQRGEESWAESWPVIGPMIHDIMAGGQAVWFEDQQLPIYREGQMGYAYWTYSFSSLLNDQGTVGGVLVTCSETTQAVESRQRLADSEAQFGRLLQQAPVAMSMSKGPQHIIEVANERVLAIWGRQADAVLGQPTFAVFPEAKGQGFEAILEGVYARGEPFRADELPATLSRDGKLETMYLNLVYEPFRDAQGRIAGVMQVAIDVTPQVLARQKLEESEASYRQLAAELDERVKQRTRDLERSNLDLMQFASVASHDLKEPLRKVQTFGTQLRDRLADRLSEEETDLFRRLVNSAARMQSLVNDVLQLSKLSDQTVTFEPVDLNAVVAQIRDDLELTIHEQGAALSSGNLPSLRAAPGQMHQLLLNLISNALKFQDGRPPDIRVQPVPVTPEVMGQLGLPSPDYAVIAVSDNGIGFNPAYKDKIFGLFQRLHGRSQYPGTGIGLTIVKRIVDNHGGSIDVQSQPGEGTTFRVALPLFPTSIS